MLPDLTFSEYPINRSLAERPNGVTHDDSNWYFTTVDRVFRFPVTADLDEDGPDLQARPFDGLYGHYGAPCFYNGRVYVPLEEGTAGRPNAIGSLDTSFGDVQIFELPDVTSNPWCAIHDGILYASNFNAAFFRVYRIVSERPLRLSRLPDVPMRGHSFELPASLDEVQGGAISDTGKTIYLTTSALDLLTAFDLKTGAFRGAINVPSRAFTTPAGNPLDPEIEGVTFWDDPGAPGISGQIHVLVAEQVDFPSDSEVDLYTLVHYRAENPAETGRLQ